ncbi:MarR family transcriptional regulator [Paracoccus gahaiensis]|uniref:MarR family transcriptional regulator n=1 Tax=Paracoccus gahaiensis TaxID=1706839 RepID=A0A4U0R7F9_9RHOB|nr:MarR family transcriptional regulator [Paracoccus gahaiensis]TJZ90939.1 MarR family transcriptional regulator [Paracoccus gahaiensis]
MAGIEMGELGRSLGYLLRIGQLEAFEAFFARFEDQDLRPGEFSVLWVIGLNPGLRQGDLAQALRIKPAHMTKIIRRLEDLGRVARSIPAEDRRSVHLHLTPGGQDFVARHRAVFFGQDAYFTHTLTADEEADLVRLLRKIAGLP